MDISDLIANDEKITHLIRKAEERDLEVVLDILDKVAKDNKSKEKGYWMRYDRDDPAFIAEKTRDVVRKDISKGIVFIIYDQAKGENPDSDRAVGTRTLTDVPSLNISSNVEIPWIVQGKILYPIRGMIMPQFRGRGLYRELYSFTEAYARANGFGGIRMEILEQSENARLAPRMGFTEVMKKTFVYDGRTYVNHFFEKPVN